MSAPPPVRTSSSITTSGASETVEGFDTSASSSAGPSDGGDGGGPHPQQPNGPRHQEDRLGLTWRTVASSLVLMTQKAERAVVVAHGAEGQGQDADAVKAGLKELDEAVVAFLRNRQEWLRLVSYLESKLEGRAKETEVLQNYYATMPRLATRKRKRDDAPPSGAELGDSSVNATER